jgi:predicted Fe-S protein YdhL (DUF1289 family)
MIASVHSPCVGICIINPANGLCRGCLRTTEEIGSWMRSDDDARRAVMDRVAEREREFGPRTPKPGSGRR